MRHAAMGRFLTSVLLMAAAPLHHATAQGTEEQSSAPALRVELNATQPTDNGCRFTFVVTNALQGELANAAFELVLFDKADMVSRLTIVDFKDLPQGKTKVRQFDFSGVDCNKLGRVLVNDATQCVGDGIETGACIRGLETETRTEIRFGS